MNLSPTINDEDHHSVFVLDAHRVDLGRQARSSHHQYKAFVGGDLIIVLRDRGDSRTFVFAFIFPFLLALALALATFARSIIRCSASAIFDLVTFLAAMKASSWLSFLRAIGNCVSIISTLITS